MTDQRRGLPLPRKQYLVWVSVLYLAEILWSMIASVTVGFSIEGALIVSIPLMICAIIAMAFGISHNTPEHTLVPWCLLVAGFPAFAMHVGLYLFHFPSRSWLNQVSFSSLFLVFLIWEILGAVYLFVGSWTKKDRMKTIMLSVGLCLLGAIGSFGFSAVTLFSIIY